MGTLPCLSAKAHKVLARFFAGTILLYVALGTFVTPLPLALAASSGPNSGDVFASDSIVGTQDWDDESNAASSNNLDAETDLEENEISNYLMATDFDFAIPNGATITGIVVEIEREAQSANDIEDNEVKIVKGGTIGTQNKASGTDWTTSDVIASYGSSSDLWGTTWTPADINAATFGVAISVKRIGSGGDKEARIDHIRITVHYDEVGSVTIIKQTVPNGAEGDFDFTGEGAEFGEGSELESSTLGDGDSETDPSVAPGSYEVIEAAEPGWDLTSISCDDENSGAGGGTTATINVESDEDVTCTFTNTQRGHIIVDKVTDPTEDAESFAFDTTGEDYAGFSLADEDAPNDQELPPGSYSVSETVPEDWELTDSTCVSSLSDSETIGALELDAGETITCTFTNKKIICGNNDIQPGEMCDDGGTEGGDGCSATCQSEACGNNVTDVGEECDDGENDDGDGCSAQCVVEVCGDGEVNNITEQCDDGNATGEDGCSADCQVIEEGFDCETEGEACTPHCGDNLIRGSETCDDGETDAGDGCSAVCAVEPGFICEEEPSVCQEQLDFGDAPDDGEGVGDDYPTLLVNDGARHRIIDGVYLGSAIDAEEDGQPTTDADGDDETGEDDDEDGVTFLDSLVLDSSVDVKVVASVSDYYLDAWVDFNADFDWDDEGEQIFTSEELSSGDNFLSFLVPEGATAGDTYSRFRFSGVGGEEAEDGLNPEGSAPNGEVEDYVVSILVEESSSSSSSEGSEGSSSSSGEDDGSSSSTEDEGSSSSESVETGGISFPDADPNQDGASRGAGTNILRAVTQFLVSLNLGGDSSIPDGGFGGGEDIPDGAFGGAPGSPLTDEEQAIICSLREALPRIVPPGIFDWLVLYLASLVQGNVEFIDDALSDPTLCESGGPVSVKPTTKPFAVSADGFPVSTNKLFNDCVQGVRMTVDMVRYNPENPERLSCGDFTHQKGVWYHPDYHVYFTWDKVTKKLGVPNGFYAYALPYNVVQK